MQSAKMRKFQRNWNVFGMSEPLLYPIKRDGQAKIHLARLLREFFEFEGGKGIFYQLRGEVRMNWNSNHYREKWTISENRGKTTPTEARNLNWDDSEYLTLKDAVLVKSLKEFISDYPTQQISLAKIIGIGGEGTVLKEVSERFNVTL